TRQTVANTIRATPYNEDVAAEQQGRRVQSAAGVEAARGSPSPTRRVVEFRTRQTVAKSNTTPGNEHDAVGDQRCRVLLAGGVEAARGVKCKWGVAALRNCRLTIPRH